MTASTLALSQIDIGGVATTVIDTGTPDGRHGPPVLLLHGSGPGVTATANWVSRHPGAQRRPPRHRTRSAGLRRHGYRRAAHLRPRRLD